MCLIHFSVSSFCSLFFASIFWSSTCLSLMRWSISSLTSISSSKAFIYVNSWNWHSILEICIIKKSQKWCVLTSVIGQITKSEKWSVLTCHRTNLCKEIFLLSHLTDYCLCFSIFWYFFLCFMPFKPSVYDKWCTQFWKVIDSMSEIGILF